jgi:hypothetical protein
VRAARDLLARYRDPHPQRLTINKKKTVCQNVIMEQSYGPRKIFFAGRTTFEFRPNMAISSAKTDVVAPGAGLAGKPIGAQA